MENQRIGHYQVARLIGRGGMGDVYEATDLDLDRRVALKFISRERATDRESLHRFEREARAAAALNHPHIATLYAFERDADPAFIAMEFLSGETLRSHLARGPLPGEQTIVIARDVASALGFAHRQGIVHRDIKPENLMFDEHGGIKVTDFGLARLARGSAVTTTGAVLGTADYMAPESVNGETEAPCDVWALGVILYEMLAGVRPFVGEAPLAVLYAVTNQEPRPLDQESPEVTPEVAALVARMLAKNPSDRPSADEVCTALGGTVASGTRPVTVAVEPERPRRHRRAITFAALLLIVVGGALALTGYQAAAARRRQEALAFNNRGFEALQRGDLDNARTLFEASLRRDPRMGRAILNLGTTYRLGGKAPQAESLFTSVLRRFPRDTQLVALAHYNLGGIDLDAQTWESAAENLAASFRFDSSSARIYNDYGYALVKVGRAGDALRVLERGIARFPSVAFLHKNAGLAALELSEPADAARHLDRALALDPSLDEARQLRERVRALLGSKSQPESAQGSR